MPKEVTPLLEIWIMKNGFSLPELNILIIFLNVDASRLTIDWVIYEDNSYFLGKYEIWFVSLFRCVSNSAESTI